MYLLNKQKKKHNPNIFKNLQLFRLMTFDEKTIELFDTETKNLESQIQLLFNKDIFSIPEIIQTYYLVTNVNSLVTVMAENFKENAFVIEKIKSVTIIISDFNLITHKKILDFLSHSIEKITQDLQSTNSQNKTKDQIELEAKKFETLREIMSTKEFVEQYDRGLT